MKTFPDAHPLRGIAALSLKRSRYDHCARVTASFLGSLFQSRKNILRERPVAKCSVCQNEYDKTFKSLRTGRPKYLTVSNAIAAMAPTCAHCSCRIIGHGVEQEGALLLLRQLRKTRRRHRIEGSSLKPAAEKCAFKKDAHLNLYPWSPAHCSKEPLQRPLIYTEERNQVAKTETISPSSAHSQAMKQ
jgi:hypothetical protein